MWQTFKQIWVFCRIPLMAAGLGLLITMMSIILGGLPLASLPDTPTALTREHIRIFEIAFGAMILSQLLMTSLFTLWLFKGRMTITRILMLVSPLIVLYLLRWLLVEQLDTLLFLTAWFTCWGMLGIHHSHSKSGNPIPSSLGP